MDGYGCKVDWDGRALTITATNKPAKMALLGEDWEKGSITLTRPEIARVKFKKGIPLVTNGALIVWSTSGKKYAARFFKRKHRAPLEAVARDLGADV